MSRAESINRARMSSGLRAARACTIRAATAAASGAAADVPKKLGKVSGSEALSDPKKVVLPPSTAVSDGLRSSGAASRFPALS